MAALAKAAFLLASAATVAAAAADEFLVLKGGVAVDEGNSVGDFRGCDLECCKSKCRATGACNSFAASVNNCYLKDKCIFEDSKAKRSPYKTYYRPCPAAGIIDATCGTWEDRSSADSDGFMDAAQALAGFAEWQNCVVQAALDGQIARRPLKFAIYRPPPALDGGDAKSTDDVAAVLGRLQGLLSTVSFAIATGRVFLLDWPELSRADSSTGDAAFQPLSGVLQCDLAALQQAFELQPGGRLASAAVEVEASGDDWLCGLDLTRFGRDLVLSFSAVHDFAGRAAYNPSLEPALERALGARSLDNNPLAPMFSHLFRPTPVTSALVQRATSAGTGSESAAGRTVGVLLPAISLAARDEELDSDGILEAFATRSDSLVSCVVSATTDDSSTSRDETATVLAVIDPTFAGGPGGTAGVLVASRSSSDSQFEFVEAAVGTAASAATSALQTALRKIAVLAACDDLLLSAPEMHHDESGLVVAGGFGLSEAVPVEWVENALAPHRPPLSCARTATAKPRPAAKGLPDCASWFPVEKSEEAILHYIRQ